MLAPLSLFDILCFITKRRRRPRGQMTKNIKVLTQTTLWEFLRPCKPDSSTSGSFMHHPRQRKQTYTRTTRSTGPQRVTLTPATMIDELLKFFPPLQNTTNNLLALNQQHRRACANTQFNWNKLMLVRPAPLPQPPSAVKDVLDTAMYLSLHGKDDDEERNAKKGLAWAKVPSAFSTSPAVYEMYHCGDTHHSACVHVGTLYAIPGLPQYPPNITPRRKAPNGCVGAGGTVVSLADYVSFLCPSFSLPQDKAKPSSDKAAVEPPPAPTSAFLFSCPDTFAGERTVRTTRPADSFGAINWRCIPLAESLRLSRAGGCGESVDNNNNNIIDHESRALFTRAVGVLLLLEREWTYFSVLMHVYNPLRHGELGAGDNYTAACSLSFVQRPVRRVIPDWPGKRAPPLRGCLASLKSDKLESPEPIDAGMIIDDGFAPLQCAPIPQTVLVHEDDTQRLTSIQLPSRVSRRRFQDAEERREKSRSLLLTCMAQQCQSHTRQEEASLLKQKTVRKSGGKKANGVSARTFSVFPPSTVLLKRPQWKEKAVVLAEEMRYGRLTVY